MGATKVKLVENKSQFADHEYGTMTWLVNGDLGEYLKMSLQPKQTLQTDDSRGFYCMRAELIAFTTQGEFKCHKYIIHIIFNHIDDNFEVESFDEQGNLLKSFGVINREDLHKTLLTYSDELFIAINNENDVR